MNWLLNGSTGQGQYVAITIGEGVIETELASGPDPGWQKCNVTAATWAEQAVTPHSWNEVSADS